MTEIKHITDKLADAIAEWAAGKAKYTDLPDDATLGKDLDFVATSTTWSVAKAKLVDSGVIGHHENRYFVL